MPATIPTLDSPPASPQRSSPSTFAVRADATGGDGHVLAQLLRRANLLTSGIGIPGDAADVMGAIRIGTNEMVRWGMQGEHAAFVAGAIVRTVRGDDPADVAARCLDGIVDGAILLMHVGSQSTDIDALPTVIDELRSEGYAFVTISGLLA